jgi:hypothetical protein
MVRVCAPKSQNASQFVAGFDGSFAPGAYIRSMPRKPIELPPVVARAFVKNMRAFLAEENTIKRDEIAARQLHALKQHYTGKLQLFDVKEMFFLQMKDHA